MLTDVQGRGRCNRHPPTLRCEQGHGSTTLFLLSSSGLSARTMLSPISQELSEVFLPVHGALGNPIMAEPLPAVRLPPHSFCLLSSRLGRPGLLGRTDCLRPTLVPRPFYSILRGHYSRATHSGGRCSGQHFLRLFFFFFTH